MACATSYTRPPGALPRVGLCDFFTPFAGLFIAAGAWVTGRTAGVCGRPAVASKKKTSAEATKTFGAELPLRGNSNGHPTSASPFSLNPERREVSYQHPDLGRPARCCGRCWSSPSRSARRTRPGRWVAHPRPPPRVRSCWACATARSRPTEGASSGTRLSSARDESEFHHAPPARPQNVTRPGAPASARGPPGTRAFPSSRFLNAADGPPAPPFRPPNPGPQSSERGARRDGVQEAGIFRRRVRDSRTVRRASRRVHTALARDMLSPVRSER